MAIQIIINQAGPLPITAKFTAPSDGSTNLEVKGSVFTTKQNVMLGIHVELDGHSKGKAQIFSNGALTHRPVIPAYIPVQLKQGEHTLTLSAAPDSITDHNDFFNVVLHY